VLGYSYDVTIVYGCDNCVLLEDSGIYLRPGRRLTEVLLYASRTIYCQLFWWLLLKCQSVIGLTYVSVGFSASFRRGQQ